MQWQSSIDTPHGVQVTTLGRKCIHVELLSLALLAVVNQGGHPVLLSSCTINSLELSLFTSHGDTLVEITSSTLNKNNPMVSSQQ